MGSYELKFKPSVEKDLREPPEQMAARIIKRIEGLASNPFPGNIAKLSGAENLFRLRIGDYRVIYEVDAERKEIIIHRIRHRSSVYRGLP